jgi:Domain of unknown function (DUF5668)
MTDPIDDTQPRPSTDSGAGMDEAAAARTDDAPGAGTAEATKARADAAPDGGAATIGEADPGPSMRADPDRPADSGWREPPWFPPRDRERERDRRPSPIAIVIGLVLIAIGLYYFLDRTLGISLPGIQWSSVWPIILIVLGGLILVRSFQRKS